MGKEPAAYDIHKFGNSRAEWWTHGLQFVKKFGSQDTDIHEHRSSKRCARIVMDCRSTKVTVIVQAFQDYLVSAVERDIPAAFVSDPWKNLDVWQGKCIGIDPRL
jgi:hypothetical protein